MNWGRMKEPAEDTIEKMTSDKLPIRPISPRASLECLTS